MREKDTEREKEIFMYSRFQRVSMDIYIYKYI